MSACKIAAQLLVLVSVFGELTQAGIAIDPAATKSPPVLWSRAVTVAVGEFFTVYTGKGARIEIEDQSILSARPLDTSNMVIQGAGVGRTTVKIWNASASIPARFDITVTPRPENSISTQRTTTEQVDAESRMDQREDVQRVPVIWSEEKTDRESLVLYVGSVEAKNIGDVARVVVGNENVLKATTLEDGSLLLLGLAAGISELDAWTLTDAHLKYVVRVYETPVSDPIQLVRAVLREYPGVTAEEKLGRVFLRGAVDAIRFESFEKVIRNFPTVINLTTPEVNVVIEDGITLDVAVLEVNRSYQRNVGIRWQDVAAGPAIGVVGNLHRNSSFGVVSNVGDRTELRRLLGAVGSGAERLSGYLGITSILGSEVQLLQEEGQARVLAAPSLTTVSGEAASFLAGGDLPVAVLNQFGQPVVEFHKFGIELDIQPIVDRNRNIRSHIRASVSSIDDSVQVNGVPGFRRRETKSTITARPGETIILSGLLDAQDARSVDKVPGLANIPVIGALFRSEDFVQRRSELVVTVTPRMQKPNTPIDANLTSTESHLRTILRGGDQLNAKLME